MKQRARERGKKSNGLELRLDPLPVEIAPHHETCSSAGGWPETREDEEYHWQTTTFNKVGSSRSNKTKHHVAGHRVIRREGPPAWDQQDRSTQDKKGTREQEGNMKDESRKNNNGMHLMHV